MNQTPKEVIAQIEKKVFELNETEKRLITGLFEYEDIWGLDQIAASISRMLKVNVECITEILN